MPFFEIYNNGERYDAIFSQGDDIELWIELSSAYNSVLEICCGTGRVLIPLLKAGRNIEGFDHSEHMLSYAKKKLNLENENYPWQIADMTNFDVGKKFELAMLVNNSFCHLYDEMQIDSFFSCLKRHLNSGSIFIIDVLLPKVARLASFNGKNEQYHAKFFDPILKKTIELFQNSNYDESTQINNSTLLYKCDGRTIEQEDFSLRIFFPKEIDYILNKYGFRIVQRYGDYDKSEFDKRAERQIIISEYISQL